MITEDYVSFEIAKLLKEKGFDEPIETLVTPKGEVYFLDTNTISRQQHVKIKNSEINIYSEDVSCPTQQMAKAWLREKDVYIEIRHSFAEYGDKPQFFGKIYSKNEEFDKKSACFLRMKDKYEDAVEDVVKYVLINLL